MNILIVDDILMNRNILKAMLEPDGHEIYEASDGIEALAVISKVDLDLVISDIVMPNMDGLQLCHAIRENSLTKHLPTIIYSSNHMSSNERDLAMECGASAFLEKPSTIKTIRDTIKKAITIPIPPIDEASQKEPKQGDVLKQYSEDLVQKLTKKNNELIGNDRIFSQIMTNISAVIWSADEHGNTIFISPPVEKATGFTPEEIYKGGVKFWLSKFHPEDANRVIKEYGEIFTEGKEFDLEYRIRRKDGEWIWIHDRAQKTRDYNGKLYADGFYTVLPGPRKSTYELTARM